jgi:DNA primase
MPKLSNERKRYLAEAMFRYGRNLEDSPAVEYLDQRRLVGPDVAKFRLGFVGDPLPGHDMYKGMLAIPYIRWSPGAGASVVSMRFRCITEGCDHPNHGKYMSAPGDSPRLYNTIAFLDNEDVIAICEGEIDTITATIAGIPAVGVAGVETWKPHFREPFLGYERVLILADGDDPGMRFANNVAKSLPNSTIVPCKPGEDVNSEYTKFGLESLMERINR